jgi:hypothetical protein
MRGGVAGERDRLCGRLDRRGGPAHASPGCGSEVVPSVVVPRARSARPYPEVPQPRCGRDAHRQQDRVTVRLFAYATTHAARPAGRIGASGRKRRPGRSSAMKVVQQADLKRTGRQLAAAQAAVVGAGQPVPGKDPALDVLSDPALCAIALIGFG